MLMDTFGLLVNNINYSEYVSSHPISGSKIVGVCMNKLWHLLTTCSISKIVLSLFSY